MIGKASVMLAARASDRGARVLPIRGDMSTLAACDRLARRTAGDG
ncbi:hypothetical protein [Sphingosinicella sp. BN140058]|nr:hypothetical protein [Sphingosinicella sp. BN140058]